MEQPKMTKKEYLQVRRSSRWNKGVPPRKFTDMDSASLGLNVAPIREDAKVATAYRSCKSNIERVHSVKDDREYPSPVDSGRKGRSGVIEPTFSTQSIKIGKSVVSKYSSMSKMELELEYIRQKKLLDEEEAKERLKAIEKKRQYIIKEMQIQQKMLETSETASKSRTEVDYNLTESLYKQPEAVGQWVENARNHTFDRNEKASLERSHLFPSNQQEFPTLSGIAGRCDLLYDLVETNELLPPFTGELTEWPIFISQFRRSTDRHNFTDEENLMRLDKALKGKAREAVKALMISPDNVSKIINMLEMNFGQTEWIILSLIDKVKKFGIVNEDRLESCISFSNAINNMVFTMKNVNSILYLYNPELLASLVEKLSPIQRRSWGKIKYHRDMQGSPISLEDFSKWFEEEINILAATTNPFQKNRRKESVMLSRKSTEPENENAECAFCQNPNHRIQECGEFIEKSIAERRQVALNLKLCYLCLKFGHMASRYRSKTRCGTDYCKGRHSELLHSPRATTESNRTEHDTVLLMKNEYCANVTSDVKKGASGLNNLQDENAKLKQKVGLLENENIGLKKKLDGTLSQIKSSANANSQLLEENTKIKQQMKQLENEAEKLKKDLVDALKEQNKAAADLAKLKENEAKLKQKLSEQEDNNIKLKQDLDTAQGKSKTSSADSDKLRDDNSNLKQKIAQLENGNSKLKKDLEAALKNIKSGSSDLQKLKDENAQLKQKIAQLEGNNAKIKKELDNSLNQSKSISGETQAMTEEIKKLKQALAQRYTQIGALEKELEMAGADSKEKSIKITQLADENDKIKQRIQEIEKQLQKLIDDAEENATEFAKIKDAYTRAKQEGTLLKNNLEKMKGDMAAVMDDKDLAAEYNAKLNQLEAELAKQKKECTDSIASMKDQFDRDMKDMKKKNQDSIAKLQKAHEDMLKDLNDKRKSATSSRGCYTIRKGRASRLKIKSNNWTAPRK